MPRDFEIFGEGIYTPRQAARLIASTPQEILRWTRGSGPTDPLWNARYQNIDDATELSFLDLIEVRVVRAFRRANISLQSIRYAIEFAKDKLGVAHPLSTLDFKTDGTQILMTALEQDGEYYSLARKNAGQKVFSEIVSQSIKNLEYDNGKAVRWRPHSSNSIVIDPKRLFGAPLLDEYGVSTKTLYDDFYTHQNFNYLSSIYDVPEPVIKNAIDYEKFLEKQQDENGKRII
ncbi:hypothetical protein [Neptunicoccus sediminis]|uniref:hypothetical protein n=1 Tax=Neptunicoccus sediminis TaxID=1892596 RepID=UPI000845FAC3|nr:hypothetical protein [Neptunicoccus sediminis]